MRFGSVHILFVLSLFVMMACSDDLTSDVSEGMEYTQHSRRTVMVYMAAENSLTYYAHWDIAEMKAGARLIPDDCKLLVYLDDNSDKPRIYEVSAQLRDTVRLYTYPTEVCSAESDNFAEALQRMCSLAPSDEYGLIVWSHASGWLPGTGAKHVLSRSVTEDKNFGIGGVCKMDVTDMAAVLRGFEGLRFVFFDACLMMEIEVLYAMRDAAEYIIGSPAEIPGKGAAYDRIMPHLFADPFDASALACEYYHTEYEFWQQYNGSRGGGVVISAVRTAEMDALAAVTRCLVGGVELSPSEGQHYWLFSTDGFDTGSRTFPDNYDMLSIMQQLKGSAFYEAWERQLWQTVICCKATDYWDSMCDAFQFWGSQYRGKIEDHTAICGVGMFIPQAKYAEWGKTWNDDYERTEWASFVRCEE